MWSWSRHHDIRYIGHFSFFDRIPFPLNSITDSPKEIADEEATKKREMTYYKFMVKYLNF